MRPEATRTVVVTGVGLAVPRLAGVADLLVGPTGDGGFDPVTGLIGRDLRHKDRATRFALRAVKPALEDADLCGPDDRVADSAATAVVVSSNTGNFDSVCGFIDTAARQGSRALSAMGLPQTSTSGIAGWVAINFGLSGPTLTLSNGPTSGLDALYWGATLIAAGRAETVVVTGVEPRNEVVDKLLGIPAVDGAAAVVLESAAHAERRGVRPRAVITGCGRAADRAGAVRAATRDQDGDVGLWLTDALASEGAAVGLHEPVQLVNVQSRLGHCSGALGVLQCAAAVAWFDSGGTGRALATAEGTDAVVALTLATPP